MCHAFAIGAKTKLAPLLPTGIYTIPEVSMVGETEQALKQQGVDFIAGHARYIDNPRGRIIGDDTGFLKLLFRRSDMRLRGVHVLRTGHGGCALGAAGAADGIERGVVQSSVLQLPDPRRPVQIRHL